MQGNTKLFALVASALMLVSVVGVGAVGAVAAAGNSAGNSELSVGVSQGDDVTVTVTSNDTAVEGANVSVTAENSTYAGLGDHITDANGTVTLPTPEENVTVTVSAEYDNMTASTTADLVATNESDEFEYDGEGPFGEDVAAFVKYAQSYSNESNYTVGQLVSQFVTENNPSNSKATHPVFGGSDDGNETDANETDDDRRGPPADKGPKEDKSKGKPAHAGGDDAETEDDEDDDEEDDSDRPDNPGKGNGSDN